MTPTVSRTITVPFIPLPPELLRLSNERDALRSAAATAIKFDLAPILESNAGIPRKALALQPGLQAKIIEVAQTHKLDFQNAFAGLVRAGLAKQREGILDASNAINRVDPPPFKIKSGADGALQSTYWRHVMGSLGRDRVVVAEGSTGLGKGRVIVAAALERAAKGVTPTYIAAPTLKIVGQLWSEYENLIKEDALRWVGQQVCFLPGITEFASPEKIEQYLQECDPSEVDQGVADWFAQGGKPQDGLSTLQGAILLSTAKMDTPMRFLMDDLRTIATEVEPASLACEDETDPRVVAARDAAKKADVVFCTHAMLIRLHSSKWAGREKPACILIDEAHEFERTAASIHSHGLALRALRRKLIAATRDGRVSKTASVTAVRLVQNLEVEAKALADASSTAGDRMRIGGGDVSRFWLAVDKIHSTLKERAYQFMTDIKAVRQSLEQLIKSKSSMGSSAWIEFSPKRTFPTLVVGRADLGSVLGSLWSETKGGVALCSATLLIPDATGNRRADYIQSVLALPRSRTDVPPTVMSPSILTIPVMHLPRQPAQIALLSRPNRSERDQAPEKETKWLDRLGKTVRNITNRPSIAGGTLVLLSSYRQAQAVADYIDPARLVVQNSNERFADTQARYEAVYRSGLKPVLIGVGTAWTGVDLTDKTKEDPAEDFLLTDLIIGCTPVGLNRSVSMMTRVDRLGTMPIEKEALMTLRQGLGRLIRRAGVENRHIWFLDGRLWGSWPGMERFQASARLMLAEYKQQGRV